jgi:hypothetical protein
MQIGVNGLITALNLNSQTNFMIFLSIRIDFMTFYDFMILWRFMTDFSTL